MEKTMRFDMLTLGAEFRLGGVEAAGRCATTDTLVKKSASSAVIPAGARSGLDKDALVRVTPATPVIITLPDPTPEELAAAEAARQADIERWARRALDTGIESATTTLARFATRFEADAADAFEWGSNAIEASATLNVYRILADVFDSKGYEAAKAFALQRALEGARHPQHSTSSMSNLVNEMRVAAYARFASNNL